MKKQRDHLRHLQKWKKRALRLTAALALSLGLCACSGSAEQAQAEVQPELVIGGTQYSPYFYQDIDGNYAGIDVEVAEEACRRIGYTPRFEEVPINQRFQALERGRVDCLWSCLTMDGREEEYQWAGPYLYTQRVVVVRADSQIESLADLEEKRVAVQAGSTSEQIVVEQLNPELPELKQLTSLPELGEVFTALRKGYADAILGHEGSLKVYTDEYPEKYRFLNMSLRSEAVGVAFLKDQDPEIVEQLNQSFAEMKEDGTLARIVESYGLDVEKNVYGGQADE